MTNVLLLILAKSSVIYRNVLITNRELELCPALVFFGAQKYFTESVHCAPSLVTLTVIVPLSMVASAVHPNTGQFAALVLLISQTTSSTLSVSLFISTPRFHILSAISHLNWTLPLILAMLSSGVKLIAEIKYQCYCLYCSKFEYIVINDTMIRYHVKQFHI